MIRQAVFCAGKGYTDSPSVLHQLITGSVGLYEIKIQNANPVSEAGFISQHAPRIVDCELGKLLAYLHEPHRC